MILRMIEVDDPTPARKTSKLDRAATVPQTDTRGLGEKPEALERMLAKELGKMAP